MWSQVRSTRWAPGLVVFATLAAAPGASGQSDPPPQSSPRIASQLLVGSLLTPVGFVGAGVATKHLGRRAGWSNETASRAAYVSAYTGAWLGGASGPLLTGRQGRAPAALGGSLVGLGAAVLTSRLGNHFWDEDRRACGIACWTLGAVTIALPSIGATIAYAASRR